MRKASATAGRISAGSNRVLGLPGTSATEITWLADNAASALAAVSASLRYRNAPVALRLDDGREQEQRIYTVAIANGRYFGGGMKIAPDAVFLP